MTCPAVIVLSSEAAPPACAEPVLVESSDGLDYRNALDERCDKDLPCSRSALLPSKQEPGEPRTSPVIDRAYSTR
jgi:hypothetical protein